MSNGACDFLSVSRLDNPDGADEGFSNNDTGEGEASGMVLMKLSRTFLKLLSVKRSEKCKMWFSSRCQGLFTSESDATQKHNIFQSWVILRMWRT